MRGDPPLVLIEARMARRRPGTGTARYITELRAAIEANPPSDLRIKWLTGPPGLARRGRLTGIANAALDLAWMHVIVPTIAVTSRASLIHGTFNWLPVFGPTPSSVTIQDLAWERMPEAFDPRFRRFATRFTRIAARRATIVVVPSEATGADVVSFYGTDPSRIRVAPLAPPAHENTTNAREPFILAVGANEPRKRIAELIRAHRRYYNDAAPHPAPCRLVVVGDAGPLADELREAAGPSCELRGAVPEAELDNLYRTATLMVYPSAYEGFGLPILEAMSFGCPVLAARNSSLPEAGGDAALYLDDTTPEAFAGRLAEVLADRDDLAARGERSRAHAATFTWERTARATLDAMREALQ